MQQQASPVDNRGVDLDDSVLVEQRQSEKIHPEVLPDVSFDHGEQQVRPCSVALSCQDEGNAELGDDRASSKSGKARSVADSGERALCRNTDSIPSEREDANPLAYFDSEVELNFEEILQERLTDYKKEQIRSSSAQVVQKDSEFAPAPRIYSDHPEAVKARNRRAYLAQNNPAEFMKYKERDRLRKANERRRPELTEDQLKAIAEEKRALKSEANRRKYQKKKHAKKVLAEADKAAKEHGSSVFGRNSPTRFTQDITSGMMSMETPSKPGAFRDVSD